MINIHYGCGFVAPETWINFDSSFTLRFERVPIFGRLYTRKSIHKHSRFPENVVYGDIIKGLPMKDFSADTVYCAHVLEHLAYEDCLIALENTFRLLKKEGVFRFVIPDFEQMVLTYVNDRNVFASVDFMKTSGMAVEKRFFTLKSFIFNWVSNNRHLWLWDYKAIEKACKDVGFSRVRRAYFEDYSNKIFEDVEEKHRWENHLGVECVK